MSDTVKLIIEIPKPMYECIQNKTYCGSLYEYLENGIPLDDVKTEIVDKAIKDANGEGFIFLGRLLRIFDNIGKESGVKPTEKKRNCKDCPYYVLQNTLTNWGNSKTTKIYGCSRWECIEDEKGEE